MNNRTRIAALAGTESAAQAPSQAEQLKMLAAKGYESDPAVLKAVATGGTPMGRWKEGLTFDGVAPMPWLKSSANWFPKTEDVQPDEIRVTFMGSSPMPRPGQMGTSVYVELAQSPEQHLPHPPALGPRRLSGLYVHVRRMGGTLA